MKNEYKCFIIACIIHSAFFSIEREENEFLHTKFFECTCAFWCIYDASHKSYLQILHVFFSLPNTYDLVSITLVNEKKKRIEMSFGPIDYKGTDECLECL